MNAKRIGLRMSAVSLGVFLLVSVAAPNTANAAAPGVLSATSADGKITYEFDGTSVTSYDESHVKLGSTIVCPTMFSCNKWYGGGTMYRMMQIDNDSDSMFLIGQKTTSVQRRNNQESFVTRVVKFDAKAQKVWDKSYHGKSNTPVASSIDANNNVSITVNTCTMIRIPAAASRCVGSLQQTFQINENGALIDNQAGIVAVM